MEKQWLCRISDEVYTALPSGVRNSFLSEKVIYNDHEYFKDDPVYMELLKRKTKASNDLYKYKFDERTKNNKKDSRNAYQVGYINSKQET